MVLGQKYMGVDAPNPSITSEIEGAPASTPGGNDGTDKTKMSGSPVASASVPPSFSSDLTGAPRAGQAVQSVNTASADDNEGETKTVSATDTATGTDTSTDTGTGIDTSTGTDTEPATSTDEEGARAEAVAGTDRKIKTIQEWMDAEENRPESDEDRKKRERRERSKKIIAAVSDGISALSNLYFTSQYAPNMYNHEKGSTTNAVDARIEKLKAEREDKRDQYLKFALKLGDVENERAATLRELEAEREARKMAREKAEREAKRFGWEEALQPDKQREQKGKADKAVSDATTAGVKADNAQAMADAELGLVTAKTKTEKAKQTKLLSGGSGKGGSGKGGSGKGGSGKGGSGKGSGRYVLWRVNPDTGKKEYMYYGRTEAEARNYAATIGWNYSTTARTVTGSQRGGVKTSRSDVSSQSAGSSSKKAGSSSKKGANTAALGY